MNSKRKGAVWELKVAKELLALLNEHFPQDQPFNYFSATNISWDMKRSEASGARSEPGDLVMSPRLFDYFPFHIEVKASEAWTFDAVMAMPGKTLRVLEKYVDQARCDADGGDYVVLMHRNRHPTYIMYKHGTLKSIMPNPGFLIEIDGEIFTIAPLTVFMDIWKVKWKTQL